MKSIVKKVLCCLLVVVVLVGCFFAVDAYRTHKAREKVVIEFEDWSEEEIAKLYASENYYSVFIEIKFAYSPFRTRGKSEETEEYRRLRDEYYNEKNKQMSEYFQFPLENFSEISGNASFVCKTPDEFYKNIE